MRTINLNGATWSRRAPLGCHKALLKTIAGPRARRRNAAAVVAKRGPSSELLDYRDLGCSILDGQTHLRCRSRSRGRDRVGSREGLCSARPSSTLWGRNLGDGSMGWRLSGAMRPRPRCTLFAGVKEPRRSPPCCRWAPCRYGEITRSLPIADKHETDAAKW